MPSSKDVRDDVMLAVSYPDGVDEVGGCKLVSLETVIFEADFFTVVYIDSTCARYKLIRS